MSIALQHLPPNLRGVAEAKLDRGAHQASWLKPVTLVPAAEWSGFSVTPCEVAFFLFSVHSASARDLLKQIRDDNEIEHPSGWFICGVLRSLMQLLGLIDFSVIAKGLQFHVLVSLRVSS